MFQCEPLHLDHLIITGAVVEWVTPLGEVVQHIARVEYRHPSTVNPRDPQQVVWESEGVVSSHIYTYFETPVITAVVNDISVAYNYKSQSSQ